MIIDLKEVELLSDVVRRICKADRYSIAKLKKIESSLKSKCVNLPTDKSIDVIDKFRTQLSEP